MRVLGIDPGTRHLGWGVLEQRGTRISHVAHGVVDTDTDRELWHRLVEIDDAIAEILREHTPDAAAVESIFHAKDAQAASKLGHARGVVLLRLARAGVAVHEYAPSRVKRAVAGAGHATKEQVARVMTTLLGLAEAPRLDASDALANAFAHLSMAPYREAMARVGAALPPSPRASRAAGWPKRRV
jgi:crossover junction endodeoxyribonuclease RuvC